MCTRSREYREALLRGLLFVMLNRLARRTPSPDCKRLTTLSRTKVPSVQSILAALPLLRFESL